MSAGDGEDPSPTSSSPVPSTSNFPPKSPKAAISMAANDDDDGNENIDEIVQDHDNFGTDENEDSMDSIMEVADDNKASDISLPVGSSAVEESLSALGEVESCCGAALRSGSKRKSDEDGLTSGGGAEGDDDRADLVKVKKQCIEEAFREQAIPKEVSLLASKCQILSGIFYFPHPVPHTLMKNCLDLGDTSSLATKLTKMHLIPSLFALILITNFFWHFI